MRRFGQFIAIDERICGVILASAIMICAPAVGARQSSQDQQTPPLGTAAKQARARKNRPSRREKSLDQRQSADESFCD